MAVDGSSSRARILTLPELNVVIFAFLLNFVWEFWQVPFYRDMPSAPHWQATTVCSLAAVGDAVIMLVAFCAVAAIMRARTWVLKPSAPQVVVFTMTGIAITLMMEWVATESLHMWVYADRMPVLPLLGIGLLPLLQWVILPPLVVWFVHRQLA